MYDSNNSDFLDEVWSRIKAYIPAKDRSEAADLIVGAFYDFGFIGELTPGDLDQLDSEIRDSVKSRVEDFEEEYGEDPEDDDGFGY